MIDVVRNRWMPPTAAQKKSDRDYLDAAGQLEVIASEPSCSKSLRPTWIRREPLMVSLDQLTWSTQTNTRRTKDLSYFDRLRTERSPITLLVSRWATSRMTVRIWSRRFTTRCN